MLAVLIIVGGILLRLSPHLPNFAPISAIALFGGVYFSKRFALLVPFLAIIISDYLLLYINPFSYPMVNFSQVHPISEMFHATTLYVWTSFLISGLIGIWIRNKIKPSNIIKASFLASLQFFIITNFGVWAGGMYSRDLNGLLESYIMGLPFFKLTMLGDLFYTGIFFGSFELVQRVSQKYLPEKVFKLVF